jgi:hypothetical protein
VRRLSRLLPLAILLGCSTLDEGDAGVVSLEITAPTLLTLEVGEQLQLTAVALNVDGEVVDAPVVWRTPDATLAVDEPTGLVAGVSPGTGRVQAAVGSLSSDLLTFTVLAPADTIIIVGDSVVPVPAEPGVTPPLVVRLESFNPPGVLGSRPVVYEITSPVAGDVPAVALPGGVQSITVDTESDGTVTSVTLSRNPGVPAPDTAFVTVRAARTQGAAVPGSGQRFIVVFQ